MPKVDWIISIAPNGIIEFSPTSDPMGQSLLANREDIFDEYNEKRFLQLVEERADHKCYSIDRKWMAANLFRQGIKKAQHTN